MGAKRLSARMTEAQAGGGPETRQADISIKGHGLSKPLPSVSFSGSYKRWHSAAFASLKVKAMLYFSSCTRTRLRVTSPGRFSFIQFVLFLLWLLVIYIVYLMVKKAIEACICGLTG